jgi:hypothetical protein
VLRLTTGQLGNRAHAKILIKYMVNVPPKEAIKKAIELMPKY